MTVWNPRRVLLLVLGVALFGAVFGVYARLLGWIDGLPQLPAEFLARRSPGEAARAIFTMPCASFSMSVREWRSWGPVRF